METAVLRARVLSALVLIPIVIGLIYLGGIPWAVAIALAGAVAWAEMSRLLQRSDFAVDRIVGLAFVVLSIAVAYLQGAGLVQVDLLGPLLALLIIASLIYALYDHSDHPTQNWAINVASALYLGFMLSHFVTLREFENGMNWVIFAFGMTWIGDTSAYFVGRTLGRHKLWPRISPKKTWEGLAGEVVACMIAGPLLGGWLVGINIWQGLLIGILVAVLGTFGDFAVSLVKRMAKAKDSGALIPGHGGVLDRLDSLLFTFPLITYFALLVAGG
jgi:phosphatidate cytidylyltransferase